MKAKKVTVVLNKNEQHHIMEVVSGVLNCSVAKAIDQMAREHQKEMSDYEEPMSLKSAKEDITEMYHFESVEVSERL